MSAVIVCGSISTVTHHLYKMEWPMTGSRQLGGLLDEQIGEPISHGAPVGCVLKSTPPLYQKHPFGIESQLPKYQLPKDAVAGEPSAVPADTQSEAVPTETEPAMHSFVPCVPMVNTAITNRRSKDAV